MVVVVCKPILVFSLSQAEQLTLPIEWVEFQSCCIFTFLNTLKDHLTPFGITYDFYDMLGGGLGLERDQIVSHNS